MTVRTILLVEDNPDDETFILHSLKRLNVRADVQVVRDGVAAMDYLKDPARPRPAVVLLDLKMPRMGGLDVLRHLREMTRPHRIPVVVFTSSSEQRDIEESYELGAASYVRKPIDFDTFCEVVRHLVQYWLDVNETPGHSGRRPLPGPGGAGGSGFRSEMSSVGDGFASSH